LPAFHARIDEAAERVVPHLLLDLALRRLIPDGESIVWPRPTALASLPLGIRATPPAGATALRFSSGLLEALDGETACATLPLDGDRPPEGENGFRIEIIYRRAGKVTRLALADHNPIAAFEAHPDKQGNHIDLGGRSVEEWVRALDEAFALIEIHCPDLF